MVSSCGISHTPTCGSSLSQDKGSRASEGAALAPVASSSWAVSLQQMHVHTWTVRASPRTFPQDPGSWVAFAVFVAMTFSFWYFCKRPHGHRQWGSCSIPHGVRTGSQVLRSFPSRTWGSTFCYCFQYFGGIFFLRKWLTIQEGGTLSGYRGLRHKEG